MSDPRDTRDVARPSARFLQLARMGRRDLETALVRGHTPDVNDLVGWEFRGLNTPVWARLVGIKKFIKGFYRPVPGGDDVYGYNCPVVQNPVDAPWQARPSHDRPRRFGFYRVTAVDSTVRDNAYLHALLLDYGRGKNPHFDPASGLRDYLVQVDDDSRDLFLGKAYVALGGARVAVSFFVLERLRPGPERVVD